MIELTIRTNCFLQPIQFEFLAFLTGRTPILYNGLNFEDLPEYTRVIREKGIYLKEEHSVNDKLADVICFSSESPCQLRDQWNYQSNDVNIYPARKCKEKGQIMDLQKERAAYLRKSFEQTIRAIKKKKQHIPNSNKWLKHLHKQSQKIRVEKYELKKAMCTLVLFYRVGLSGGEIERVERRALCFAQKNNFLIESISEKNLQTGDYMIHYTEET